MAWRWETIAERNWNRCSMVRYIFKEAGVINGPGRRESIFSRRECSTKNWQLNICSRRQLWERTSCVNRALWKLLDSQTVLLVEEVDVDYLLRCQSLFVRVLMAGDYSVHQNWWLYWSFLANFHWRTALAYVWWSDWLLIAGLPNYWLVAAVGYLAYFEQLPDTEVQREPVFDYCVMKRRCLDASKYSWRKVHASLQFVRLLLLALSSMLHRWESLQHPHFPIV